MVFTRSRNKRNRPSYVEEDSEDDNECLIQDHQALEQAIEYRKHRAKKQREARRKRNYVPVEMIPPELLPKIFSYLDNAKEIYQLSLMSKSFRQAISPELVVQSALFQGGDSKNIVEKIMHLLNENSIYTPSTERMLRLVNAIRCERGRECCSFNLVTRKAGSLIAPTTRPFGLALCLPCLQAVSTSVPHYRLWYMKSSRACVHEVSRLLCCPQVEEVTKQPIGSLVLFKDIKQIENTYVGRDKRVEMLEKRLAEIDPTICVEDTDRAAKFVAAFDLATDRYAGYLQAKNNVIEKKRLAKEAQRAARKIEAAKPIYKKIESLLDAFKYKDDALACEWNESTGVCNFTNWPSQETLGGLMAAPSYASQKKIGIQVEFASKIYMKLESEGFLDENFLRFKVIQVNGTLKPHERALIEYFVANKTPKHVLRTGKYEALLEAFAASAGPAEAIFSLMETNTELRDVFASGMVDGTGEMGGDHCCIGQRSLAIQAWQRMNPNHNNFRYYDLNLSIDTFGTMYRKWGREYSRLAALITEYKGLHSTQAWLKDSTAPLHPGQTFSREDAIGTLYHGRYLDILSASEFALLLLRHKVMFHDPPRCGLPIRPSAELGDGTL